MAKLIVHNNKKVFEMEIQPRQTLLEAGISNKVDPPYSCLEGVCCSCEAKLIQGVVHVTEGLEAEGHPARVKTCQALPRSETIEISFDE